MAGYHLPMERSRKCFSDQRINTRCTRSHIQNHFLAQVREFRYNFDIVLHLLLRLYSSQGSFSRIFRQKYWKTHTPQMYHLRYNHSVLFGKSPGDRAERNS